MSNEDLTSKRIASKWRVLIEEFAGIYQKRVKPKEEFFPTWDAEEPVLVEKLKRRPLQLTDIEALFSAFRAKMLKAL